MPRLWTELPRVRLCHVVHDEILLDAPEALAPAAADLLLEVMQDSDFQTRYIRDCPALGGRGESGDQLVGDPLRLPNRKRPDRGRDAYSLQVC